MSASNALEAAILGLLFQAQAIANIADNAGTSPLANLYIGLHTADPGEAGDQTTNEATYTSYARVAVARTTGGFAISGSEISNVAEVAFPAATGGTNTITHFSIGTLVSGAGVLLFSGALAASLAVSAGITPRFAAGVLTCTAD